MVHQVDLSITDLNVNTKLPHQMDPEPIYTMANPSLNGTLLYIFQDEKIRKISVYQKNHQQLSGFYRLGARTERQTWELNYCFVKTDFI